MVGYLDSFKYSQDSPFLLVIKFDSITVAHIRDEGSHYIRPSHERGMC